MTARSTAELADALQRAAETCTPVPPVRGDLASIEEAYAVQTRLISARRERGERVVGRKIGLTSPAVQEQLGVDQPDFGVLTAGMQYSHAAGIPAGLLLQPRIEAEVAFVLGRDITTVTPEVVRTAVDHAVAALEIVDSRIADWDISILDTVADNASSGLFVLGPRRLTLDDVTPADVGMSMSINGEVVSTGTGADCLGDPLEALAWLAETALRLGDPLRAGQVVLAGALGPMAPVRRGDRVRAVLGPLGEVEVVFDSGETQR